MTGKSVYRWVTDFDANGVIRDVFDAALKDGYDHIIYLYGEDKETKEKIRGVIFGNSESQSGPVIAYYTIGARFLAGTYAIKKLLSRGEYEEFKAVNGLHEQPPISLRVFIKSMAVDVSKIH